VWCTAPAFCTMRSWPRSRGANRSWSSIPRSVRVNLHSETLECDLDFFVSFSSVASYFGAHGRPRTLRRTGSSTAHGLAKEHGLPGLSLSWPAWIGAGMAHRGDVPGCATGRARPRDVDRPRTGDLPLRRLGASNLGHVVIGARHDVPDVAVGTVGREAAAALGRAVPPTRRVASRAQPCRAAQPARNDHRRHLSRSPAAGRTSSSAHDVREMGLDSFQAHRAAEQLRAEASRCRPTCSWVRCRPATWRPGSWTTGPPGRARSRGVRRRRPLALTGESCVPRSRRCWRPACNPSPGRVRRLRALGTSFRDQGSIRSN